jgi:hypothetical protein
MLTLEGFEVALSFLDGWTVIKVLNSADAAEFAILRASARE